MRDKNARGQVGGHCATLKGPSSGPDGLASARGQHAFPPIAGSARQRISASARRDRRRRRFPNRRIHTSHRRAARRDVAYDPSRFHKPASPSGNTCRTPSRFARGVSDARGMVWPSELFHRLPGRTRPIADDFTRSYRPQFDEHQETPIFSPGSLATD